jgi:hypothetical protein
LIAFKTSNRSIFLFGFSKNDRENLDKDEDAIYKQLSKTYLSTTLAELEKMCKKGLLVEVDYEKNG